MITLTKRQRDLLLYLLKNERYTTYNQCAETFGVSNRSIRNDMQGIEAFLEENACHLIKKSGVGVRIQCEESKRSDLKREMSSKKTQTFNRKERQEIAILVLLLKDTCTFQEIADICYVSKQTMINCFDDIQKGLEEEGIVLERVQGVGLRLLGDEISIRRKFLQMMTRCDRVTWFWEIIKELNVFQGIEETAEEMLDRINKQCGISFAHPLRICYILSYCLLRNQKGHVITGSPETTGRLQYNNADAVLDLLQNYFSEKAEQDYAAALLFGERMNQTLGEEAPEEENDDAYKIARYLVDALKQLNQSDFEPTEMEKGLTLHLRSAIYRYHNHISIQNEMLDEIKMSISLMYEFTRKKLREIEGEYNLSFDENEIAYIAMYIASIYETSIKDETTLKILVVCSFGMATSSILKTRILSVLPDCDVLGPLSQAQAVSYLRDTQVDAIIATNEFDYEDIPVIQVNPLLGQRDIDKINNRLYQYSYSKMCRQFIRSSSEIDERKKNHYLRDYIKEEDIQIVETCSRWEEAIQLAAAPLLKKGLMFQSYVDSMIWAVKEFGTYMVLTPRTAYVHAGSEDGVQENCTAMLVLKEPLEFGDTDPKRVSNIVVLGIRDKEKNDLLNLAYILEKKTNISLLENRMTDAAQIMEMHD